MMKKYILLLVTLIATISINAQIVKVYENNILKDTYVNSATDKYSIRFKDVARPGDPNFLNGVFSISDSKMVKFTKANLYWDGSDFKFEANQTDYPTTWDPNHVGHFFWTTSAASSYAEAYTCYASSSDVPFFGERAGGLTVEGTSSLFALNKDEWNYLINGRKDASMLKKYGVSVSNNGTTCKNCVIFAPDGYVGNLQPDYTLDELNSLGFLCLPPNGDRVVPEEGDDDEPATIIGSFGENGQYWASTFGRYAYYPDYFSFLSDDGHISDRKRNNGLGVRLVAVTSEEPAPSNILPYEFTVGIAKTVRFTRSNLYWNGSEFKFEANQTDYPTNWDANHVGHFFWAKKPANSYSKSFSDGTRTTSDVAYFAEKKGGMTIEETPGLFALSKDEWDYLLNRRNNAANLRKSGVSVTNNGTTYPNCQIIAPNQFTGTLKSEYTLDEINDLGLVCLPPAGEREEDTGDFNRGQLGYYWSSTPTEIGEMNAYCMYANTTEAGTIYKSRSDGRSLRLVTVSRNEDEYIDLGLPSGTLWATRNIGASSPEEFGEYFAWGETEQKGYYDWPQYKFRGNTSSFSLNKYITNTTYAYNGIIDDKTVLDPEDDAATVKWGTDWRMPTAEECIELCTKCTWTWTKEKGVQGRRVTGPNGNSIFLPAAGYYSQGIYKNLNQGVYWSCTLDTRIWFPQNAQCVLFSQSEYNKVTFSRELGLPVRPVRKK